MYDIKSYIIQLFVALYPKYEMEHAAMKELTCCATGHRDVPVKDVAFVKKELKREIEQAIEDGYTRFISGFANGVDLYFAEIVAEARRKHPRLRLEAAIPYRKRLFDLLDDKEAKPLLLSCTDIVIHAEKYTRNVFAARNRYMVTNSNRIIAVYDGRQNGGTLFTLRLARTLQKDVHRITISRNPAPMAALSPVQKLQSVE